MTADGIDLDLTLPDALAGAFEGRDRLTLRRRPGDRGGHRAWDNADRYLLDELAEAHLAGSPGPSGSVLVAGDHHGALTVALSPWRPTSVVDLASRRAVVRANLERNGVDPASVELIGPLDDLPDGIGLLVVRPPRSLDLLEHQLRRHSPRLLPNCVVIGADMTRHVHTSTLDLFERFVGETRTSLARRRARLIRATVSPERECDPPTVGVPVHLEQWEVAVAQYPGVFGAGPLASGRADRGTTLLLESLDAPGSGATVLDLGSGNGLLGAVLAKDRDDRRLIAVDDSSLAVAATTATLEANGVHATVLQEDVANPGPSWPSDASVDVVVCNPPFHDGRRTGDEIAWTMFAAARRALRDGGECWVVGNRHLGYHVKLRAHFAEVTQVGGDERFVVLRARTGR